jgi:hypothetical protein
MIGGFSFGGKALPEIKTREKIRHVGHSFAQA